MLAQRWTAIMNGFRAEVQPAQERKSAAMSFSFLARQAGRVHVCGHRGYSLLFPENTMPAIAAAKTWGATTIEIDVVLTAEGEPVVLHDRTLDRTTDGHGFAADFTLGQIRSFDAAVGFHPHFAGTRIPTLTEVLGWAKHEEIGLLIEIKETERPDFAVDRVAGVIRFRGLEKSTLFSTQIRPAMAAIRPNSTIDKPPITGSGIERIRAPNFGEKPSRIETTAATTDSRVE
jgi:Glycerophosphoryl diester phosphodiesterase family